MAENGDGGARPGEPGDRDPAEIWGRRAGRAAAVLALIALTAYLALTYLSR